MDQSLPLVAVINTSQEVIELLQEVLTDAGFTTVSAYTTEFKRGQRDLRSFFAEYQPQAVVYDIAIPYVENWEFFQEHVIGLDVLPARCFIVTCTNVTVLEMLVGATSAIELIGRPFDLDTLIDSVRRAIAGSVARA